MRRLVLPCVLGLWAAAAPNVHADVQLPRILGSHMVLQRDRPLPVWGWADPGEEVTVQFGDSSARTRADDKGAWSVKLPARGADSKGQRLTVAGKNKIELEDVLVGEVWVG